MTFRCTLWIGALFICGFGTAAQKSEEQEIRDTFIKQMVDFTAIALEEMDPQHPGFSLGKGQHTHDPDVCYPMAYLYKTRHPLNPYYGHSEIRDKAIAICDRIAADRMGPEWPLYLVCQVYDLLRDEVPEESRRLWKAYAEHYNATQAIHPYFTTAANHEAWNALAVFRTGQVFAKPRWAELGRRLMRQLLKLQADLGYFDEGKHHGPSLKYNQVQLAAMLLYHDYSKDEAALQACKRLADFMVRYSFPDGSPIGTFDGRQSYSLGYFGTLCYGLDRWPAGKELNRRIYRSKKRRDVLSPRNPYYSFSNWYANFAAFYLVDECQSLRPDAPAVSLPQDRNGYRVVERGPSFSGGVIRQHDWVIALSAIDSDVPKYVKGPYELERQSRLDIWNEKAGLIIGGGHNMVGANPPLANFLLLGGYHGVTADFGLLNGGSLTDRQAVYFPRKLKLSLEPEMQTLVENFGQGDVSWTVRPINPKRLEIDYRYDVFGLRDLFVQLPLIIFHDSKMQVDERPYTGNAPVPVNRQILIQNPTMGATVKLLLPQGEQAMIRYPISPLRWYKEEPEPQRYQPYYRIALVSVRFASPHGQGGDKFVLEVE